MQTLTRQDWEKIEAPYDEQNHIVQIFSKKIKFHDDDFASYQPGMSLLKLENRIAWYYHLITLNEDKYVYMSTLHNILNAMIYYNLNNTIAYKKGFEIYEKHKNSLLHNSQNNNYDINFKDLLLLPYAHQTELVEKIKVNNLVFYNVTIGKTCGVFGLFELNKTILYVNNNPETCKIVAKIAYNMKVPFAIVNTSREFLETKRSNICGNNILKIVITDYKRAIELLKIKDNDYLLYADNFYDIVMNSNILHSIIGLMPERSIIVGEYINDFIKFQKNIGVINNNNKNIVFVDRNFIEHREGDQKIKMKPPDFNHQRILIISKNPFKKYKKIFKNECRYKLLDSGICICSKRELDTEYYKLMKNKLYSMHIIFVDLTDLDIKMPYDYIIIDSDMYENQSAIKYIINPLTTSIFTCVVTDKIFRDKIINDHLINTIQIQNNILKKTQEHPRHPCFNDIMASKYDIVTLDTI